MTGEAFRVDAHEDRLSVRHVAHRDGDVLGLGVPHARAITVDGELAVLRRQLRGCDTLDKLLAGHPVSDQVLHRDEPQTVSPGNAVPLVAARHRAVEVWLPP